MKLPAVTFVKDLTIRSRDVKDQISVTTEERAEESYRQEGRGRPTKASRAGFHRP